MKIKLISFCCLFILKSTFSLAASFHAILLCDTELGDIGSSVSHDKNEIIKETKVISETIGYHLNQKIFSQDEFNHTIFDYIDSLNVEKDDIIFFYFSGHGFHSKNTPINEPWPELYLSKSKSSIDFKEIHQALEEKNARFLFALADCCNNIIPISLPQIHKRCLSLFTYKPELKHYENLFLKYSGKILIASASTEEFAYGTSKDGGFFTYFFLINLKNYSSWNKIIDTAIYQMNQKLSKKHLKQTPHIEINIKEN